jgi:carbon monoxide dehydrogenase subunit G
VILDNQLDLSADPDAVFALINDVERVASCLPGAILDGQEGDAYLGRVKFKVGPISAAYAGKVRFTEVIEAERRLRLSARGSDSHGNGDAEADVTLTVAEAPGGSSLNLHTDLMVRGKIAQFGRGAISAVSNRLLDQFALNLAAQLRNQPSTAASTNGAAAAARPAASGAVPMVTAAPATTVAPAGREAIDGLAMLLPPEAKRYLAFAAVAAVSFFQGWLLGRIRSQDKLIKELQRGR